MKFKKTIALLLALTLVCGLLAGCGDKNEAADNKQTEQDASEIQPTYAYQASFIPMTDHNGESVNWIDSMCLIGDKLYYSTSYSIGETEIVDDITGETMYDETTGEPLTTEQWKDGIFSLDLETREVTLMQAYEPSEIPEGYSGSASITGIMAGADDTIWVCERLYTYYFDLPEDFNAEEDSAYDYYTEGETIIKLMQYSAAGEKLQEMTLDTSMLDYVYFDQMAVTSQGLVVAYTYENLYLFNMDGSLKSTISGEEIGYGSLCDLGNDQFGFVIYDNDAETRVLKELNLETGELVATDITLPANVYDISAGYGEYIYTYQISDSVFGVREDGTKEKLFSWLDCDVNINDVDHMTFLSDGRVLAREYMWSSSSDDTNNVIILNQVDASTLPKKQELTLGCMGLNYDTRNQVIQFNRSHQDVRITVRDYSELITDGSDYTTAYMAALQKLNTEILSGSAPDILCTSGLPVEQYIAGDILVDLWPLIDSDEELSREDLMEHFFDVMSVDGKLYEVTDTFAIRTAVVSSDIADGRTSWTLDELLEALNGLQPGASIFSQYDTCEYMLESMVQFDLDKFVDWQTGTCNFDSEAFLDILNFANQFPLEVDTDNIDWETEESEYTRLKTGKQLMVDQYVYSFDDVQFMAGVFENKATYIGYPTSTGSGSAFIANNCLAITASCENVEAAWSLVRTLLLEENQVSDYMYNFPTNAHAFERYKKQAMTAQYETDPETGEQVEVSTGGIGYNDFMVDLYSVKQEDFDAFWSVYENCQSVTGSNDEIMELITDQASAFFAGQKTAEETAKLIQDRVGLYMMEQG